MAALPPYRVVAIFGPTASGKTDVAEALAGLVDGEVVSADAMQVYRGLPILTDQPEQPTRLVGIWPLSHESSLAEYALLAHDAIDEIVATGRVAIVAGGTGLYLRGALVDLDVPPAPAPGTRERWEALYDERGAEALHEELATRDPAAAAAVHPNDRRRVVRALELAEAGLSLRPARDRLWTEETRHPTLVVGLDVPPDELERRIVTRNRRMVERGVLDEVRGALAAGPISETARHVHGLQQLATQPLGEALAATDVAVRRYAAYQRKWMRRVPGLVLVDGTRPPDAVAREIAARMAAVGVTATHG